MQARLFQPARTAMQQGKAKTQAWTLEFESVAASSIEPLMGRTATPETQTQVQLHFETKEAGLAYAAQAGLMVEVQEPARRNKKIKPKSYSDNFAADRLLRWTH